MTIPPKTLARVEFLARVVRKECRHLITTDEWLFDARFTLEQIEKLEETPDIAEHVPPVPTRCLMKSNDVLFYFIGILINPRKGRPDEL
ncbi:MAG: hypothetical protein KGZ88_21680 [Methylomicrobium sp.]|nr:hypothetical protein [Methylomicrobium sp.]